MTQSNFTPRVKKMCSPRTGNPTANQFIIDTPTGHVFQSYRTIIAKYEKRQLTLDTDAMNYSRTTSKYLYEYTRMNRKELEQGIAEGYINVQNLN